MGYLEHLTDSDRALLGRLTGEEVTGERLEGLLRRPGVAVALFQDRPGEPLLHASPFLVFAALVERVAVDLRQATSVGEWLGPGRTVPVFDVESLREFLAPPASRLFLVELLASYTHVTSGTFWYRTGRGWRRQRYSELDPLRLAELLRLTPESGHAALLRRLGDLCLFLAGVFPEHAAARPLAARHLERLGRLLGGGPPVEVVLAGGGLAQLEWLGGVAYGRAGAEAAGWFRPARRVLNLATERYLQLGRSRWFGAPGAPG